MVSAGINRYAFCCYERFALWRDILFETATPGVFAVGDVRHGSVKRVASAVGEGSVAIRLVHDSLALAL
jgi:thioredoxin reductase